MFMVESGEDMAISQVEKEYFEKLNLINSSSNETKLKNVDGKQNYGRVFDNKKVLFSPLRCKFKGKMCPNCGMKRVCRLY